MIRIIARKNLPLLRYRGEGEVDLAAKIARSRFATTDKYQIYADKREEAVRFLEAIDSGIEPSDADYPYLSAETGISAATMLDLAYMWLSMDMAWKSVAALIEKITISAKVRIRQAGDQAEISKISAETQAVLDVLGAKPPIQPKEDPLPSSQIPL